MSRDKQRLADYLAHILEAIERIERFTERMSEGEFLENQMLQDAVIRNIEIIGEASHNVEFHYTEFATAHPELPLAAARSHRNLCAMIRTRADASSIILSPTRCCRVCRASS
jgi:uncharacterized protein with HEPN domain